MGALVIYVSIVYARISVQCTNRARQLIAKLAHMCIAQTDLNPSHTWLLRCVIWMLSL